VTDKWTHKKYDDYLADPWVDEKFMGLYQCEGCEDFFEHAELYDGLCRKCETKSLDASVDPDPAD
jgi:hypothetical protein